MLREYRILIGLLVAGLTPTACSSRSVEANQAQGIPWQAWLLIIVVMAALFVWLWLSEPKKKAAPPTKPEVAAPTARPEVAAPSHAVETPEDVARHAAPVLSEASPEPSQRVEVPVAEVPKPDALKLIAGIGPKISGLLQAAGITTFAQLAATDVSRLKEIIAEAGLTTLADPTTWPEQATLAADGQWDALEALQNELKGGRRV